MDDDTNVPLRSILDSSRTVAVLGASNRRGRPAYYVPAYLDRSGYRVLPVNPRHLGESLWSGPFRATLAEIDEPVDVVNVFRRSGDVPEHVDDILAMDPLPRFVWMQLGIRNDEAAERLRSAGIDVVQDRCILVEHQLRAQG